MQPRSLLLFLGTNLETLGKCGIAENKSNLVICFRDFTLATRATECNRNAININRLGRVQRTTCDGTFHGFRLLGNVQLEVSLRSKLRGIFLESVRTVRAAKENLTALVSDRRAIDVLCGLPGDRALGLLNIDLLVSFFGEYNATDQQSHHG